MSAKSVVLLGGGVAGLSAAVLLARDGHRVTVVERDALNRTTADAAFGSARRGIPHYLQPHAFIPRGRSELRGSFPDVYEALLNAGASEVDVRRKLAGSSTEADEELQYLAVRRPVIEWGLRQAAADEPGITILDGQVVDGLAVQGGRVRSVQVNGQPVAGDLFVDALGRRTPTADWLRDQAIPARPPLTSDCGVVYYSRYYRFRPGFEPPDGPWFLSPRGDLGYLAYASFPGDNRTFAALLAVPNGVPEWKALHTEPAFEAAVALVPSLASWADPGGVEPLTPVMAMAGLRNSLRSFEGVSGAGLFPVGDAYGHTDPVLAHGLAFALIHAAELARSLRDHDDLVDAFDSYVAATHPALQERYDFATELDEQRRRLWVGEPVDFAHHDGDYALFTMAAGGVAATTDAELARVFLRRIGLLDSTSVLDDDIAMRVRIQDAFAKASEQPRPRPGPAREEMLAAMARREAR